MSRALPLLCLTCACTADASFGVPAPATQPIYNGTASSTGATVALTFPGQGPFCSGTLITPRVVLTAAHCLEGVGGDIPYIDVFFGSNAFGTGTTRNVTRGMMHPNYDGESMIGDIAALELSADAPVAPIPHLTSDIGLTSADVGTALRFEGFGETDEGGYGHRLMVDGTIGRVCASGGGCSYLNGYIPNGGFGYAQGEGGPCGGDSGGPAYMLRNGVEYVVGVTSFGDQTCWYSGVSTTVDRYDDFLQAFINHETIDVPMCEQSSCMPGMPCGGDGACGPRGVCFTIEDDAGFVGGYCSSPCSDDTQCPTAGTCVDGYCLDRCASAGDCRAGYECYAWGGGGVCLPEEAEPGTIPPGGPCSVRNDCAGDDGFCMTEDEYGFPSGMCSWPCNGPTDCPARTACDGEICWPSCQRNSDCRPDWACWPDPDVPGAGWCVPSCQVADWCENGDTCNAFGLCGTEMPPRLDAAGTPRSGDPSTPEESTCAAAPGGAWLILLLWLRRRPR
jgi:hypothetical protein